MQERFRSRRMEIKEMEKYGKSIENDTIVYDLRETIDSIEKFQKIYNLCKKLLSNEQKMLIDIYVYKIENNCLKKSDINCYKLINEQIDNIENIKMLYDRQKSFKEKEWYMRMTECINKNIYYNLLSILIDKFCKKSIDIDNDLYYAKKYYINYEEQVNHEKIDPNISFPILFKF